MSNEFKQEERYVVFKLADLGNSLKGDEIRQLAREYAEQRRLKGKEPLKCVVVESNWPEYETTWKAIEARVTGAQPAPKAVAYLDIGVGGYMDIGTDLTDEALAAIPKGRHMLGIVGTYGVEGYSPAQPAPRVPEGWKPIPEKHPTFDLVDLRLADGSVLCGCVPQSDGDYWWEGPSGEVFIDPKYAPATHWRLAAAPEAKP